MGLGAVHPPVAVESPGTGRVGLIASSPGDVGRAVAWRLLLKYRVGVVGRHHKVKAVGRCVQCLERGWEAARAHFVPSATGRPAVAGHRNGGSAAARGPGAAVAGLRRRRWGWELEAARRLARRRKGGAGF